MRPVDFLAIGDPVVDEFIELKDATVHCTIDDSACTISMRWGDKIPFVKATVIAGVGNSANAAVSARRLGLSSALIGIIGDDAYGAQIQTVYEKEGLDRDYLTVEKGTPTNHHYVLSYQSERTILVKHEAYAYTFPKDLPVPKVIYLSSLAETIPDEYYTALADFLDAHPDVMLAFQPGTFQMKLGVEKLSRFYKRSTIFFCNKEEAHRILKQQDLSTPELLARMSSLGPRTVVITDGRNGAYALYDGVMWFVPMYPDPRAPFERTGAGDAFASTVTSALVFGEPLEQALLWGPINSMSVVQKIGAQEGLLSKEELLTFLSHAPETYTTRTL